MPHLEHIEANKKQLWSAADTLRANSNYASNEYSLVAREKAAPGKGRQVMSGRCWSSVTEELPANPMVRDGG